MIYNRLHIKTFFIVFALLTSIHLVLIGCEQGEVQESSTIQVGFTTNLYDIQPHLARIKQTNETHEIQQATFFQSIEELDDNIIEATRDAGYDYIELNTAEIALLSDDEFEDAVTMIQEVGLPVPVTNVFVPGHIKLVGPNVDFDQQNAYLQVAYERIQRLGVEYLIFGSAGARAIPDGFPREEAWDQLVEFSFRASEMAADYDIIILIESLNKGETNFINSVAEGFELVREVDHPNFQVMIDFYHLALENEDPDIVLEVADHLHHLHMANPEGRVFPFEWDEHQYYEAFFRNLREIGYDKRISIEARFDDLYSDSQRSIQMMREAFDADFELN